MKHLAHLISGPLLALVLALVVASCRRPTAGPLDAIPADAAMVMAVDMEALAVNAGCDYEDNGRLELSWDLAYFIGNTWQADLLTMPALDLTAIYLVQPRQSTAQPVLVAPMDDGKALKHWAKKHADNWTLDTRQGWTAVRGEGVCLGWRDGLLWMGRDLDQIISVEKAGRKNPISDVAWQASLLTPDDDRHLAIVVMPHNAPELARVLPASLSNSDNSLVITGTVKDLEAEMEIWIANATGRRLPMATKDMLAPITDAQAFTSLLTAQQVACLAIGVNGDHDWDSTIATASGALAMFGAGDAGEYLQALLPYLKELDGTAAVAVGSTLGWANLVADSPDWTQRWAATVYLDLKPGEAYQALAGMSLMAREMGGDTNDSHGSLKMSLPGGNVLYAKTIGQALAVSTLPFVAFAAGDSPIQAKELDDRYAAAVVNLPAEKFLALNLRLPWGVKFNADQYADRMSLTLRLLPGESSKARLLLEAILSYLTGHEPESEAES